MPILIELKLTLIECLSSYHRQRKSLSPLLNDFITECSEIMTQAETAADLALAIKKLIEERLAANWANPFWYFSDEYQLKTNLLKILAKEEYSLINLLIKSSSEDRQTIEQLKYEKISRELSLRRSGLSPSVLYEYEHQLRSYKDRHEIDMRRIEELSTAADELLSENIELKKTAAAASILTKLKALPSFDTIIAGLSLSPEEGRLISSIEGPKVVAAELGVSAAMPSANISLSLRV